MTKSQEYFMEVVRCGSLTGAARKLYISQPSLTKFIQRLEKEVGVPLFDRSVSPMRLSDSGQIYYEYLLDQEQREQQLLTSLSQVTHMERGTLRLGVPSFFGQCYLPRLLAPFSQTYPLVQIALTEASGEQLEQNLLTQQIDLALMHLPVTNAQLEYTALFAERILLAVPSRGQETFRIRTEGCPALNDLRYILPRNEQKLGRFTAEFFARHGIRPEIYIRSQNANTMLALAAAGMGAAFVPEGGLHSIHKSILEKLRFYHLPGMEMTVAALRRRGSVLTPYAQHLISLLTQNTAD